MANARMVDWTAAAQSTGTRTAQVPSGTRAGARTEGRGLGAMLLMYDRERALRHQHAHARLEPF